MAKLGCFTDVSALIQSQTVSFTRFQSLFQSFCDIIWKIICPVWNSNAGKAGLLHQIFFLWACIFCEYCQKIFNKFYVTERLSLFCHTFTKFKTQLCHQFWVLLVSGKNTLLFFNGFFQMFNFVHSCLTNNFIKLGGVLTLVMTFNIILFDDCNSSLTNEAQNTLVVWDNKIFCALFTVEHPSFVIHFSFLSRRHFTSPEINNKILPSWSYQNRIWSSWVGLLLAKIGLLNCFKFWKAGGWEVTSNQGSHSVISNKPRLFMKKKHLSTKKQKCQKTHECKFTR